MVRAVQFSTVELLTSYCASLRKCIARTYCVLVFSVRPSVQLIKLVNHWTDSDEIWCEYCAILHVHKTYFEYPTRSDNKMTDEEIL